MGRFGLFYKTVCEYNFIGGGVTISMAGSEEVSFIGNRIFGFPTLISMFPSPNSVFPSSVHRFPTSGSGDETVAGIDFDIIVGDERFSVRVVRTFESTVHGDKISVVFSKIRLVIIAFRFVNLRPDTNLLLNLCQAVRTTGFRSTTVTGTASDNTIVSAIDDIIPEDTIWFPRSIVSGENVCGSVSVADCGLFCKAVYGPSFIGKTISMAGSVKVSGCRISMFPTPVTRVC